MAIEHPRLPLRPTELRPRTVVFAGVLLLLFLLPWRALLTVTEGVTAVRLLGALVGLAWLAVAFRGGMRPLDRFHVVLAVLVGWVGLSVVWTIDTTATLFAFVTLLSGALFCVVLWDVLRSENHVAAAAVAYLAGCYVVILVEGVEFLLLGGSRVGFVISGPNYVVTRLVFGLPLAWYVAVHHAPYGLRSTRYLAGAYLPVASVVVAFTMSRQGFIALVVALGLLAVMHLHSRRRVSPSLGAAIAAVAAAIVLALVVLDERFQEALPLRRFEITVGFLRGELSPAEAGLGGRLEIYSAGIDVFLSNLLLGTGAGSFPTAVEPLLGSPRTPHSTYLAVAAETGLVGFVLLAVLVAVLVGGFRHLDSGRRMMGASLLVLYLLVSLVNTWFTDFTALFVLTMVLLAARPTDDGEGMVSADSGG